MRRISRLTASLAVAAGMVAVVQAADPEPPNPFGQSRPQRTDAVEGTVELSNGRIAKGKIYLTRSHEFRIYDAKLQRTREIPLRAVAEITCIVEKEWMEKEWRFKEAANDEKIFTGRSYPARLYVYEIKLKRGDSIKGPLAALLYVDSAEDAGKSPGKAPSPQPKPIRYVLHKRDKGKPGQKLKDLIYVKRIVLTRKK